MTNPMPPGPKSKVPKIPKTPAPKSAGKKSDSAAAKAEEGPKNKTPDEIKKEKMEDQVQDKTAAPANESSKEVDSEKAAVQKRIQGCLFTVTLKNIM